MPIKEMQFDYTNAVKVISKEQFEAHKKLYQGYVIKTNEIEKLLLANGEWQLANSTYSEFRCLKRGETFALNGVILHELYFENISGINGYTTKYMQENIMQKFGGYAKWRNDFVATAMASRGWVIFIYEQRTKKYMNISLDSHDLGIIAFSYPLIVLDMYEHAYFFDYKTDKESYINRFLECINWDIINKRIENL